MKGIERRGVDLLDVEVAELGFNSLPDMLVSIPGAVLHAGRRHVLRIPLAEEKLARARDEILARAFLCEYGLGSGHEAPLPLPSETRDGEVVLP